LTDTRRSLLITGCSSGIGHDAAHGLAKRGWRVRATCRAEADCERLRAEGLESFRLDLADEGSIAAAVDYVRDRLSPHYEVTRIDGVRIDFPDGWGLIRASNTESVITTRFEAHTPERVAEIRALIIDALTEFRR